MMVQENNWMKLSGILFMVLVVPKNRILEEPSRLWGLGDKAAAEGLTPGMLLLLEGGRERMQLIEIMFSRTWNLWWFFSPFLQVKSRDTIILTEGSHK